MAFRRWFGVSDIISSTGPSFITLESHVWIPQVLWPAGYGMHRKNSTSTFCEHLCLLILFSVFPLSEPLLWRLFFLCGGHNINTQSSFFEALDFVLSCVLWDSGKGRYWLELRVKELDVVCHLRLFLPWHGEGLAQWALQFLAVSTHRNGPKRVKIMLRRRCEFFEILCLMNSGVFSFSWLWCDNFAS